MRTLFIPEVMKIPCTEARTTGSRSAENGALPGKAYSIAESEEYTSEDYCYGSKYIWRVICFHRYCIHGDIQLFEAKAVGVEIAVAGLVDAVSHWSTQL